VNFTGSPGRFWRVWLPYADPSATLLLQLNFGDVPDRRYLWTTGRGRLAPLAAPPSLTDNSPGGSYFWDQVGAVTVKCLPPLVPTGSLLFCQRSFSVVLCTGFCVWHGPVGACNDSCQVAMTFTLKIAGGQMFEIRTESVLYVTPRLAMSVDDFFAQKVICPSISHHLAALLLLHGE